MKKSILVRMDFLDKNYVKLDLDKTAPSTKYLLGEIKNTTDQLKKVFGLPKKLDDVRFWKFKIDSSRFTIYEEKREWHLASNTNDEATIKYFLKFLTEARSSGTSRGVHKKIPDYSVDYQLKGKIALFHVPPVPPPGEITIDRERKPIPTKNHVGELVFEDYPDFRPNLTPKEVLQAGSFGGTYFRKILSGVTGKWYEEAWKEFPTDWFKGLNIETHIASQVIRSSVNKYGNKAGGNLDMWESSGWITEIDPYGWFQWYCRFYLGRRSSDDGRQIRRWSLSCGPKGRFRTKLFQELISKGAAYDDYTIGATGRQGILHWGYEITKKDLDDFRKRSKVTK